VSKNIVLSIASAVFLLAFYRSTTEINPLIIFGISIFAGCLSLSQFFSLGASAHFSKEHNRKIQEMIIKCFKFLSGKLVLFSVPLAFLFPLSITVSNKEVDISVATDIITLSTLGLALISIALLDR
jgi:hypothetical protein